MKSPMRALLPPDAKAADIRATIRTFLFCASVTVVLLGWLSQLFAPQCHDASQPLDRPIATRGTPTKTLVLYSFFHSDEKSIDNLFYFLRVGVQPSPHVDFVIVLNGGWKLKQGSPDLPPLPPNARYLTHKNECYDWGTFGWVLQRKSTPRYKYFVFVNSSVRGPILPAYMSRFDWTSVFTQKLTAAVKLVGSTISCERFCIEAAHKQPKCQQSPHVQSYAFATDEVGLEVLQKTNAFTCHRNRASAIWNGEIAASRAIMQAGYTIDSLQIRYQGVDWRSPSNWHCNMGFTPLGTRTFDGLTSSAVELVFAKLKDHHLKQRAYPHFEASVLSTWIQQAAVNNVTKNWYLGKAANELHAENVLIAQAKGADCFDWDFYLKHNPDVAKLPRSKVWNHFLRHFKTESRMHRWLCGLSLSHAAAAQDKQGKGHKKGAALPAASTVRS